MCHNNLKFAKQEQNTRRITSIIFLEEFTTSWYFRNFYHLWDLPGVYIFFDSFKEYLGIGSLQKLTKVKRKARTQFSLLFFFGIRISNFSVLDSPSVSTLVTVNESSIIFTWYIGYCGQKFANSSLSSDRSTISLSTVHLLSIIFVLSLCNSCKTATRCQYFSAIPMQKRNHASPDFSPISALVRSQAGQFLIPVKRQRDVLEFLSNLSVKEELCLSHSVHKSIHCILWSASRQDKTIETRAHIFLLLKFFIGFSTIDWDT